ncbi:HAD family hydrolase [Streptomyces halobius]|uniref:Haloacid dehalogenase-like hydrolase n=1 Tax=Streptomyces halobius TaxID=2879846 RepID=A0ABY4M8S5_9ACTN|nr:hypothetical protein [Streptomyces halobius]UQA94189.1 hypothetical protein K9S39_22050 [Streptomyces halobius]
MQPLAFFDLDNTLIARQTAVSEWLDDFSAELGLDAAARHRMAETLSARAFPEDFARLRCELGLAVSTGDLWRAYVDGITRRAVCRPEVLEGLIQMRASGWALANVSSGV